MVKITTQETKLNGQQAQRARSRQAGISMGEVMCPREVLEQLASIQPVDEHDDNGPGRVVCPVCDAWMSMLWSAGERKDDAALMTHSDVCAAEWARAILKPANSF